MRRTIVVGGVLLLAALLLSVTPGQVQAQDNLLKNPGFEQPFKPDVRADGGGYVAHGWSAWWQNDAGDELDGPEYKQANIAIDPYRVRSGQDAQQYFRPWARHLAGLYQRVLVPANSKLRFTIFGHAWSSFCKKPDGGELDCDPRDSFYGEVNPIAMKIGIDPTGGTDPFSPNVVWSPARGVYDNFEQFAVEATAQGAEVTVFVYSNPEWPAPVINVYWDDAELAVIGEGGDTGGDTSGDTGGDTGGDAGGDAGGGAPVGGVAVIATQPPQADGSVVHIVQAGDTLGGIAVAYGVETQAIRELNGLTSDIIWVGQRLVIKPAGSASAEAAPAEPAEEEAEERELAPTPAPSPTPMAVAEAGGSICLSLFDDANGDALLNAGEGLLAGGVLSISGPTSNSHITDGITEPFCFGDLPSGDYMVSVTPPDDYVLTGLSEVPVTLSGSGEIRISFGAAAGESTSDSEMGPGSSSPLRTILTVVGVVVGALVLLAAGAAVYLFVIRPRRASVS